MKKFEAEAFVRPNDIDDTSSPTTTYINYSIKETKRIIPYVNNDKETTVFKFDQLRMSKQEYAIYQTVKDWTAEQKQARINELQSYLSDTDWYAARLAETGVKIPKDIKHARADARIEISLLRDLEEITNE